MNTNDNDNNDRPAGEEGILDDAPLEVQGCRTCWFYNDYVYYYYYDYEYDYYDY